MMKIVLTLCIASLLQSLCFAQGFNNIDWEYRLKGDTLAFSDVGTGPLYDTLLFRKGCIISKSIDNSLRFISHSFRTGIDIPSSTIITFEKELVIPKITHNRMFRGDKITKNNFLTEVFDQFLINIFISRENSTFLDQNSNTVRMHGWHINNPQIKYNLDFILLRTIPNVQVLSHYKFYDKNIDSTRFKCVSVGNIVTDTNTIPYLTDYVLSQNNFVKSINSIQLPPQTSKAFEPIAHSFQELQQNHILLFGNVKDSLIDKNGFDIVIVDTTLNEIKRVSTDSTQMMFSNGIISPTNLFTVNDKIFVTGFIDYGNMQYPFYTEHSSNGEFVKSLIVNTNVTIHSGSVSPDGKTVLMCGSIMNANDNKDFFVASINTETGSSTQQTWGDNRENELFDVLAISSDTAYVTGSEDKDFYAARLVNLQTMSADQTKETENNIEISPNPASSSIAITVKNLQQIQSKLTIQNMQGQTVATIFEGIPSSTEVQNVSIEHLPTGAYFVTIQNGHTIHKSKFVVKR